MNSKSAQISKKAATRWVVVLTGIGSLMAALDTLVVSTALTTIRLDLGASVEQLEWTVNAYNLSFAVLLMTASALGDRFGRRRHADRRASDPGRRRRVRDAARPRTRRRRLPAGEARRRDGRPAGPHRPL